ncbi:hypothetical protein [Actinospica robiniae]|uniref:hypothetical protein n=1 Tax=Actinospica robiniae TaxID=304901 RepID=UPI0003FD1BDD|nr:hypothetical protein [Actinospica robiniae]
MIPRDHAHELATLTGLLTAEGWEEMDLELGGSEVLRMLTGVSLRLLASPGRQILLTAIWREEKASTSIVRLDGSDPRAALWHVEATDMPVVILYATCRAAVAGPSGTGPIACLRAAGWLQGPVLGTEYGTRALIFDDPDTVRWASAQYRRHDGRLQRGPWIISRADVATSGGERAHAHTDASAPGAVIAALALTDDADPA